ncbi:MAG: CDP-alcohol phosphatidyltransferase family protein [Candidatus Eisenbacteria bacterium]
MASVGYLETVDGRRMRSLGGPNTITLARAVFVPSLIYLLAARDFGLGLIAYAALVLSDIADGWWARHGRLRSKFGIVLDPVADLFLHGAVFSTLGLVGLLPRIAILLILLRSGLLIVGSGLLHFHKGSVRIQPTPFGKGSGVLLGLATSWLLALEGFAPGREPELTAILRGVLTSLLALLVLHALAIGIINLGWRKPWLDQRRRGLNEQNGDDRRGRREP